MSTIFAQTTPEAVIGQYHQVVDSLHESFPEITAMLPSQHDEDDMN